MKILICADIFPGLAGIATYCENISREFVKNGHEVSIICERINNQKEIEINYKRDIRRVLLTRDLKKDLKLIKNSMKKFKEEFDLIIILWYKYFRPALKAFSNSKKVYVLPSVRKIDIRMINKKHPFLKKHYYILKNKFSVRLEKEAIRKSDLLVNLCKNMKRQVKGYYKINKGTVIYPGVNHKQFKLRKIKKDNTALIVANFDPRKGLDRSVKVVKHLKNSVIKIIGDGGLRKELETEIVREKVQNKIQLLGRKNNVEYYMNKSFVYLMTSYSESFGQVLLEAMASGLPCIAFKPDGKKIITASDEIIKDGVTGFLVKDEKEMAEKIDLLLSNEKLREKMGKAARKEAEKYSWEKCAKEILKFARE